MLTQSPPIRIIAPGQVYRRDDDPTHSPMFIQLEGLCVDEGITFADLKGVLLHFVRRFFGKESRHPPAPELLPVHRAVGRGRLAVRVLRRAGLPRRARAPAGSRSAAAGWSIPMCSRHVGIDRERYTGFAFGMGLERMAMLRYGVNDIKYYYEGDVRFLEQFVLRSLASRRMDRCRAPMARDKG